METFRVIAKPRECPLSLDRRLCISSRRIRADDLDLLRAITLIRVSYKVNRVHSSKSKESGLQVIKWRKPRCTRAGAQTAFAKGVLVRRPKPVGGRTMPAWLKRVARRHNTGFRVSHVRREVHTEHVRSCLFRRSGERTVALESGMQLARRRRKTLVAWPMPNLREE